MLSIIFEKRTRKIRDLVQNQADILKMSLKSRFVNTQSVFPTLCQIFDIGSRGIQSFVEPLLDCREGILKGKMYRGKAGLVIDSPTSKWYDLIQDKFDDSWNKAITMADGYNECYELILHSVKGLDWIEYLHTIGHYFLLALNDELEEFLKYQTAVLVAFSLDNHVEEPPACVVRGHFRLGDFFPYGRSTMSNIRRHCIQRRSRLGKRLAYSLYQTKSLAPPARPCFVIKALDKNLLALTTEQQIPDRIDLIDQVNRTVDEIFDLSLGGQVDFSTARTAAKQRNKEFRFQGCPKGSRNKLPSLSACYEFTRSNGGAFQCLLESTGWSNPNSIPMLMGYVSYGLLAKPIYGLIDDESLAEFYKPSFDGMGGRVLVRREPILEPFKVRIISKGQCKPYQLAQRYQPWFWSMLQTCPVFDLTGRPVDELDLDSVLKFGRESNQHTQIVSGDYKAATDNLHVVLCEAALARYCFRMRIPFHEALILKSCLTGHKIDNRTSDDYKNCPFRLTGDLAGDCFGDLNGLDNEMVDQKWGQLMGSPISFPILCSINAAVTRYAMEIAYGRTITLLERSLLVNGDDVIFTIPSGQYQTWVDIVTDAGLSPSVGKNFVSRRYGVINSQMFDCGLDWDRRETVVTPMPILYMNLLRAGLHKVDNLIMNQEYLKHGKNLQGQFEDLIKWQSVEDTRLYLDRAYHYARPLLSLLPPVSWTLPRFLGGLGLPSYKASISLQQRKVATLISCSDNKSRREILRLEWLKGENLTYLEEAHRQHDKLLDGLKIPLEWSPSKGDECPLWQTFAKSHVNMGIHKSEVDTQSVLRRWGVVWQKLVNNTKKIKWGETLHLISDAVANSFHSGYWGRSVTSSPLGALGPLTKVSNGLVIHNTSFNLEECTY